MTTSDNLSFFDDLERQLVAATTDRPARLRRARTRRVATLCTILVACLAVGGGVAAALSNGTNNDTGGPAHRSAPAPATTPATTVPASSGPCASVPKKGTIDGTDLRTFEVAVLNGTTVPGLARGVATTLQSAHYKIGTVTNAATQDQTTTRVYYASRACATAATLVAQAITLARLHADPNVHPVTPGLHAVAGDRAAVIVVVGSDSSGLR